jgi:hypothetical protein
MTELWRTVWRFLKKLKTYLPYDPPLSLLGVHPKEMKSAYQRDACTPVLIHVLFTITKTWNQPRCLLAEDWIKKNVT